jgi:hypothetical protein
MTTQEQVRSYLEQPKRYYNIDGLGEIGIGVMMLGLALFSWLQASTPKGSLWNRQSSFFVCVALMLIVIDRGTKLVKQRITYPRTGFVEYRRDAKAWMAALAAGSLAIASLPTGVLATIAGDAASGAKSRFTPDMVGSWLLEALFVGAVIGISGGITLVRYLRETQAPQEVAE